MSKAAPSPEKRIVSAFIALHGGIPVNMLDYHQPENTFIFNVRSEEIPSRYNLYAPDVLGRSYILTDPSTSNFIYEKIEEWKRSPMASGKVSPRQRPASPRQRPASPRARSVSSRARSASPRSRPAFFSEFIAGELTHFEQTDTEAIFNGIDDMYKESHEKQNGMKSKEFKKDISHMRTSALLKNEVIWKKHKYCIGDKDYIVPSDSSRVPKATIDLDKEIIVVIETFKSDGTRVIEDSTLKLKGPTTIGIPEIANELIIEYSLEPTDEINFFDFTCSGITFPTRLYGLGQYNMNLLSSNRNPDGSAKLTFGTITKKRSFEDAFRDDGGNDDGSPSADSASSMKVHTPGSRRSSSSSPKHSPADHKSPYSPTVSGGPTIVVNVPKELVSYVSFTGHRHGGGSVRRKYTRRKQYTKKTRP
jgi:hypothetical protein